jgi:hypothetical protein
MKHYVKEVEIALSHYPQSTSKQIPESYIGGGQSKLRFFGLRTPDVRATLVAGFSFSTDDQEAVAKVWDHIWHHSDCFEVMSLALGWYESPKQAKILVNHWPRLKKSLGPPPFNCESSVLQRTKKNSSSFLQNYSPRGLAN